MTNFYEPDDNIHWHLQEENASPEDVAMRQLFAAINLSQEEQRQIYLDAVRMRSLELFDAHLERVRTEVDELYRLYELDIPLPKEIEE